MKLSTGNLLLFIVSFSLIVVNKSFLISVTQKLRNAKRINRSKETDLFSFAIRVEERQDKRKANEVIIFGILLSHNFYNEMSYTTNGLNAHFIVYLIF